MFRKTKQRINAGCHGYNKNSLWQQVTKSYASYVELPQVGTERLGSRSLSILAKLSASLFLLIPKRHLNVVP